MPINPFTNGQPLALQAGTAAAMPATACSLVLPALQFLANDGLGVNGATGYSRRGYWHGTEGNS
ncbi:MAG: hypothetical protein AB7O62_01825 [Pirellulales bacterium]